uniref:Glutathione S-transferase n=1 Tax=Noctiluca scintillans TaxID=2966 RepID=A0A7S0ZX70_NOCSC|mmetsp:Transcript_2282/g.6576  ORF Transcript_2282/g.6576 Transcript_2282/m.6576 type:complete len:233 (+) Transcript_2282:84-782(+)
MASADAHRDRLPKLTYLDGKGVVEPIRVALSIGGVAFEDERVSYEEIRSRRALGLLPTGQVPVLDLGDQEGPYSQSQALLRWAGRQSGLYPDELQLRCDIVCDTVVELTVKMGPWWYGAALGRHPVTSEPAVHLTEEQRKEVALFLNDVLFPSRCADLERLLVRSGGPFFCGSRMTICDLSWWNFASPVLEGEYEAGGISARCLSACPQICALVQRITDHPDVKAYYAERKG